MVAFELLLFLLFVLGHYLCKLWEEDQDAKEWEEKDK